MMFRDGLQELRPYPATEAGWPVKLDANERALAWPAAVAERVAQKLAGLSLNRYPEITQRGLKEKIAAAVGLTAENVCIGNGSSELLGALCHVFGGRGRRIVYPEPSFSMYPVYCRLADCEPAAVKLKADFSLEPEAVLDAARAGGAALVLLCNPNNPTGQAMAPEQVEYIVANAGCPVVVDEAYQEFYGQTALAFFGRYDNLIITRTFSKAYGLAGARVGYALASPAVTAGLGKVLLPYHINSLSLAAAEALVELRGEMAGGIAAIAAERDRVAGRLGEIAGIEVFPSVTNFLLLRTGRAAGLTAYLAGRGTGIRDFSAQPGLEGCLRVSIGSVAENDLFLAQVKEYFGFGVA